MKMSIAIAVIALMRDGCGPCGNEETTTPILPPANGDAAIPSNLPDAGALSLDECKARCDAAAVVSCSFDDPGGLPTLHCVVPAPCE